MAGKAELRATAQDRLAVVGPLTFETVGNLWRDARGRVATGTVLIVDLDGVERADSAGLALLVECLRAARARGGDLRFLNVPAQLVAIARTSRLDRHLFPG